jgi:molybdenum cofactor biosynthesis enzyme MoaA
MIAARVASLMRRLRPAQPVATPPPAYRGAITEVSARRVDGWLQSVAQPAARVAYEVALKDGDAVLARGTADQFRHGLGVGDGAHGFTARLPEGLDPALLDRIVVRPAGSRDDVPRSPDMRTSFQPVLHVAMDIVDNCNLRCPFCLYDYANTRTTHLMDDATFAAALRFLPFTRDGEFWLSCLHEPTLHPKLADFIARVPQEYRRKLCYTTNLAKRMPASYYALLADAGLHHLNVSIESLQPALYERMRKGARHRIFMESWDALLAAIRQGAAPPSLNYISMVYKSNVAELPDLSRHLLAERNAATVQLRYTFDVPHLAPDFRASEFLDADEWLSLRDRLAPLPPDRVQLLMPPDVLPAPPSPADRTTPLVMQDYYLFGLSWDGTLRVNGVRPESRGDGAIETEIMVTNVNDIADPAAFLDGLAAAAQAPRLAEAAA